MTTFEVAELFKQYVDDSDQTFMSPDNAVTFLNIGYREFVSQVAEEDSNFYATQELYTAVNDDELDLATTVTGNTIMGATPTGDRLYRIMRVSQAETSGNPRYYLQPSRSLVSVRNGINLYMLRDTKLIFSGQVENILVEYVGFNDTPFTLANIASSGAGVFIDDLTQFHDLVALLACKQYQIKDFAANPVLMQQLAERKLALMNYLSQGRTWASTSVVASDELDYLQY